MVPLDFNHHFTYKNIANDKNHIANLLQGQEITIKADVIRGINKNAIKFNDI